MMFRVPVAISVPVASFISIVAGYVPGAFVPVFQYVLNEYAAPGMRVLIVLISLYSVSSPSSVVPPLISTPADRFSKA